MLFTVRSHNQIKFYCICGRYSEFPSFSFFLFLFFFLLGVEGVRE
uniref:Uncharacterized protein n=1 Tax=Rhizophora mucronata TaxID=61149 RepID=A0A2P2PMP0_RHIMU